MNISCKVTAKVLVKLILAFTAGGLQLAAAQNFALPERMYYKFDSAGSAKITNDAQASGKVNSTAAIAGNITIGGTGMAGSALNGTGNSSSTDYVSTGWSNALGTGSWTISFWLNNFPSNVTAAKYFFGDSSGSFFRCFTGGLAGNNNLLLRASSMNDVKLSGLGSGPFVVHYVYSATANEIKAYLNGQLQTTVSQSPLNITGSGDFKIGGYGASGSFPSGSLMDEFRMYDRALGPAEVYATWNHELPYTARNMKYVDAIVFQGHDTAFPGKTSSRMLQVKILTQDILSPLKVNRLYFSSTGTSNSDISKARLYYTGQGEKNTGLLPVSDTAGAEINSPAGSFSFGLNKVLNEGENNFYLVFDVNAAATVGNELDVRLDSIALNDDIVYPAYGDPTGSVYIDTFGHYCQLNVINPNTVLSAMVGLTSVKIGDSINNFTTDLDGLTLYHNQIEKVYRQQSLPVEIKYGKGNSEQIAAWVDWNNDGLYDSSSERVFYIAFMPQAGTYKTSFTVPCSAQPGYHKMRIASDFSGSATLQPCKDLQYGDAEEYVLEVLPDPASISVSFKTELGALQRNSPIQFTGSTTAKGSYTYDWDFDNNGAYDQTGPNPAYTYTTNGKKTAKVRVTQNGCNGSISATYTDTFTIYSPQATPVSDFVADIYITNTLNPVKFLDASKHKPNQWNWQVNPAIKEGKSTFAFINGTGSNSRNPEIQFLQEGKYEITLTTYNSLGQGTVERKPGYIEVAGTIKLCNTTDTVRAANGYLYDDGGKDNPYAINTNCSMIIKPACAESVTLTFNSFDVSIYQTGAGPAGDYIRIYDGTGPNGQSLNSAAGAAWGFQNKFPNNGPYLPPAVTAKSGAMYIEWHSDGAFLGEGFEAVWTSVLRTGAPPKAAFTAPDSAYIKTTVSFVNNSEGNELLYFWDLNGDGVTDVNTKDPNFQFNKAGIYSVRLVTNSCGGTDTLIKLIKIIAPQQKPAADFQSAYTRVSTGDKVQFTDLSYFGPYAWEWTFTNTSNSAAVYTFTKGSKNAQNPEVSFLDAGYYTVSLTATNDLGQDVITKTQYIEVYQHCQAFAVATHPSVGISHVKLTDVNKNIVIDQSSSAGSAPYTYHQLSPAPLLEVGGYYTIQLSREDTTYPVHSTLWIDYNGDGDFSDIMEDADSAMNITGKSWSFTLWIPLSIQTGISRIRVGVSYLDKPSACGYNRIGEFEDYNVYLSPDLVKPVISLKGGDTLILEEYTPYTEYGATAIDNVDGNITHKIKILGKPDTSQLGTYQVKYTAVDRAGNEGIKYRTVRIIKDTSAPVLSLKGASPYITGVYMPYIDPGVNYKDNLPGGQLFTSGQVDTSRLGEYFITYTAVDTNGRITEVVRKVIVADTTAPVITLLGPAIVKHQVYTPYADPGVKVSDNYSVKISLNDTLKLDVNAFGTYYHTFVAKDSSGNISIARRTIIVDDYIKPILRLYNDTILWDVNRPFVDPPMIMGDNYYTTAQLKLIRIGFLNIYKFLTQELKYVLQDGSGNLSDTVTLVVKIVDRIAPTLTMVGDEYIALKRWETYLEPGYVTSDNYDTFPRITIGGTFKNTQEPGNYYRIYRATDRAGNSSPYYTRWIIVYEDVEAGAGYDPASGATISLYPNPATDKTLLQWENMPEKQINVYLADITGRVVQPLWQGAGITHKLEINTRQLPAGVYFLHMEGQALQVVRKLVVTH